MSLTKKDLGEIINRIVYGSFIEFHFGDNYYVDTIYDDFSHLKEEEIHKLIDWVLSIINKDIQKLQLYVEKEIDNICKKASKSISKNKITCALKGITINERRGKK